MTVAASPVGPEQQISDPLPPPLSRHLGRFTVPIAPTQALGLGDGRVVVAYEDELGVFARIVSRDGTMSAEITVDQRAEYAPRAASLIPIGENQFVVLYRRERSGWILARFYHSDGSTMHQVPLPIIQDTPMGLESGIEFAPSPISLRAESSTGMEFGVVWNTGYQYSSGISFCRANLLGTRGILRLLGASTAHNNSHFNACVHGIEHESDFVFAYQNNSNRIYVLDSFMHMAHIHDWQLVGTGDYPAIAELGIQLNMNPVANSFIVAWHDTTDNNIYFKMFGTWWTKGDKQRIFTDLLKQQVNQSAGGTRPAVARLTSGKFVVVWEGADFGSSAQARVFHHNGLPATGPGLTRRSALRHVFPLPVRM
jgi:hypothetical protein